MPRVAAAQRAPDSGGCTEGLRRLAAGRPRRTGATGPHQQHGSERLKMPADEDEWLVSHERAKLPPEDGVCDVLRMGVEANNMRGCSQLTHADARHLCRAARSALTGASWKREGGSASAVRKLNARGAEKRHTSSAEKQSE